MQIANWKKVVVTVIIIVAVGAVIYYHSPNNRGQQPAVAVSETRVITDMFGRQVAVPKSINRVLTGGPVETQMVYLIAPEKLSGLSIEFDGKPPFVNPPYNALPYVGGWGGTRSGNYETFIASHPDVIMDGVSAGIEDRQKKFGSIPVVGVDCGKDLLLNYQPAIEFLGRLLGAEPQAQELSKFYKEAMSYVGDTVAAIPAASRVKVYCAEGKNGLSTDPKGAWHTALLDYCGGINVADVTAKTGHGMVDVSLEQILLWDPDVIVIGRGAQEQLYKQIVNDKSWNKLRAVKNRNIIIRPVNPISWFASPPGPGQIIGMYWLVHKLYPAQTAQLDLNAKIREFYAKFLHYQLTDNELAELLNEQR
ncbi:MAG: ABC transporter substrate-binding protein [Bacillota bacterium]